ncbi:MAG TPA: response regulator [Terriglobales bacterium]|nr:response regulator [Terriglobales bacterium]
MKKTILVADDNEANRELISVILQRQGYEVLEAPDGREALAIITRRRLDLVLLDIHMPELDGFETVRAIRQSEQSRRLPVVALTASAMAGDAEQALARGFTAYLAKPYEISAVISLVQSLVGEAT